jgi:hypothetical protein
MKKLVLREFESFEYQADVKRIISICAAAGYEINETTAREAWERYSEDMAAGWMSLHNGDNYVLQIILNYTTEAD